MHICFVASEGVPFAKVGGLADVVGSLPAALRALGHRVTVVLPFYRGIDRAQSFARRLSAAPVPLGGAAFDVEVFEGRLGSGVEVVLLRRPDLFERDRVYTSDPDEALRFAVLSRAAPAVMAERGDVVDVFHCHDWQTALVPYYLRRLPRPGPLKGARTLLTIHNMAHQMLVGPDEMGALGIDAADFHPGGVEFYGKANLLKAGIVSADRVSTVSPTYAGEITTPDGGHGLDGVLRALPEPPIGILNGIDPDLWNPATDPHVPHRYDIESPEGRFGNKMALQHRLDLPIRPKATLAAAVARLVPQKGLDLVAAAAPMLLACDLQIVVIGDGDPAVLEPLERLARDEPERVRMAAVQDDALARLAYAGSDLFLAPSRFEPCGLTQMIAMRYGSAPVVRATGGLVDTVVDVDARMETGTGFVFHDADPADLARAVRRAVGVRAAGPTWAALVERVMRVDHSWGISALRYEALYRSMVEGGGGS